eukprot:94536_1
MSSKAAIEKKREELIEKARQIRDKKNEAAQKKYDEITKKAQQIYDKQMMSAHEKYDDFIAKVEEDTDKRLKIVNKVIDAEAEERIYKEEQIRRKKESEEREAAEQRMREEADKQRKMEEEKQRKIAAKKAAKAKKKRNALRAKVPIPPGYVSVSNSKKLYAKLKKINSAGRYGFCCFSNKGDKKFRAYCEGLSQEYNSNVAWFDCTIKDTNFEDAMLLYEFNATPAVVICFEGKPSNLHRYVIGNTDDAKETLKRYAEKADAE